MTDKDILISDLNDISEILNNNGYGGWCKAIRKAVALLKEQEAVVHPEPSCEMTYITDCCCDLCGVQLIREDNFCRCCGKPIDWSK